MIKKVKPMAETLKEELQAIRDLEKRGFIKANAEVKSKEILSSYGVI